MKKISILLILAAAMSAVCLTSGCGSPMTASGTAIDETYDYADFSLVEAASGFELEITRSDGYAITVTADENFLDAVDVSKNGEILRISLKGSSTGGVLKAEIAMPALSGINLSGGSQATISGFSSDGDFSVTLSDGSTLEGAIVCGDIGFGLSGGSRVFLSGSGSNLVARSSEGSQMMMGDFPVNDADINIDGGGRAFLDISGRLDTTLTGGSTLTYTGDPEKGEINVSGGSTLTQE